MADTYSVTLNGVTMDIEADSPDQAARKAYQQTLGLSAKGLQSTLFYGQGPGYPGGARPITGKEMGTNALVTGGQVAGGLVGGLVSSPTVGGVPLGVLAGESAGGMGGLYAAKKFGWAPPEASYTEAGGAPLAGRVVGGIIRGIPSVVGKLIPGSSIAQSTGAAERLAKIPGGLKDKVTSEELYTALEKGPDPIIEQPRLLAKAQELAEKEARIPGTFKSGEVQGMATGLRDDLQAGYRASSTPVTLSQPGTRRFQLEGESPRIPEPTMTTRPTVPPSPAPNPPPPYQPVQGPQPVGPTSEGGAVRFDPRVLTGGRSVEASTRPPAATVRGGPPVETPGEDVGGIVRSFEAGRLHPEGNLPLSGGKGLLTRIGERIGAVEGSQANEARGAMRQLRQAHLADMEAAAASGKVAKDQVPLLREANRLYRRENAIEELAALIEANTKGREGDAVPLVKPVALERAIKDNKFLQESFTPEEMKAITETIRSVRGLPTLPPRGGEAATGSSKVWPQMLRGGALGGAAGLYLGNRDPIAGLVGSAVGGMTEQAIATTLAKAVTTESGRRAILAMINRDTGFLDHRGMGVIAQVVGLGKFGTAQQNEVPPNVDAVLDVRGRR